MSPKNHRRTFISYSRTNKEFALKLALELRSSGFDIWLDQLDIPTGARWDDEVELALEDCEIFMVILTPASSTSDNVKDEIGYAIDSGKRILPILLENAKVPLRLRRFQYVDFTKKNYEDGVESAKQLLTKLIEESTIPRDLYLGETQAKTAEKEEPEEVKGEFVLEVKKQKAEVYPSQTKAQPITVYPAPSVQEPEPVITPLKKKSGMPLVLGTVGAGVLVAVAFAVFAFLNRPGEEILNTGLVDNNLPAENIAVSPVPMMVEAEPTKTLEPTAISVVVEAKDTPAPTALPDTPTPGLQKYFTEEFDQEQDSWQTFNVDRKRDPEQAVITKEPFTDVQTSVTDSSYLFDIQRRQTTIYSYFDAFNYEDVRMDVRIDSRNVNSHNATLVCRYTERDGWYEFRIAHNGLYGIYYAKPNINGLITFRTIADGGSTKVKSGNAVNEYSIICQGNELSLYINGELTKKASDLLGVLRSGKVGVSVSSLDGIPVLVGYDWVKISEPE